MTHCETCDILKENEILKSALEFNNELMNELENLIKKYEKILRDNKISMPSYYFEEES